MAWAKKNKVHVPKPEAGNAGGVHQAGSYIFVIVKPDQEHWALVDTLIHESVHVFRHAMEYVGDKPGEESEAYHIGHIATTLLKDFHALHDQRQA
jgi:hypothetical protein